MFIYIISMSERNLQNRLCFYCLRCHGAVVCVTCTLNIRNCYHYFCDVTPFAEEANFHFRKNRKAKVHIMVQI